MSLFRIFDVAGSGMVAQSQRLNVVASNLANADSVAGPDGKAYKARQVVFEAAQMAGGAGAAGAGPAAPVSPLLAATAGQGSGYSVSSGGSGIGVKVSGVVESSAPAKRIHDPKHPMADGEGYVTQPNVNVVEEMVNMISASRSYQANAEVMNTAKTLMMHTLQITS